MVTVCVVNLLMIQNSYLSGQMMEKYINMMYQIIISKLLIEEYTKVISTVL